MSEALTSRQRGVPLVDLITSLSAVNNPSSLKIKTGCRTILPDWRQLNHRATLLLSFLALARSGQATAFSVNLSHDLRSTLVYSSTSARDIIRNRITRELAKQFRRDIPFAFTLELDSGGRLHFHGAAGIGPAERDQLKACLKRAGGDWNSSHGGVYQVDLRDLHNAQGWADYISKTLRGKDSALAKAVIGKSRSMTRLARNLYADLRQLLDGIDDKVTPVRISYLTAIDRFPILTQ